MQARIRIGLLVGLTGLLLNICVAGFLGFCGPFLSLVAGGLAGLLAAGQEKPLTKADAARAGGIAGGIAGGMVLLGQVIGGVAALYYMQSSGIQTIFGQVPGPTSGAGSLVPYYFGGLAFALCFGLVGAILAAAAGALAAYLSTSDRPFIPPSQDIIGS